MLGGLSMANNPIFMRTFLILMFPAIMVAQIGYGAWLGLISGIEEFNRVWRYPTDNRWNKTKWE
jgi:hypothetical protein